MEDGHYGYEHDAEDELGNGGSGDEVAGQEEQSPEQHQLEPVPYPAPVQVHASEPAVKPKRSHVQAACTFCKGAHGPSVFTRAHC